MPENALPLLSYLLDASMVSLCDLELAAHNRSANLGKEIRAAMDAWVEQRATAMLARWMMENRDALLSPATSPRRTLQDAFDWKKKDTA